MKLTPQFHEKLVSRAAARLATVVIQDLYEHKAEARKLRKEAHYVDSTPRCGSCMHMQFPLRKADGVTTCCVCRLLVSRVTSTGLCDHWTGADGATLDG